MMNDTWLHDPAWSRALTLAERAAARSVPPDAPRAGVAPTDLAAQRLHEWKSQRPFEDRALFARRLAGDGLPERELQELLGEPIEALQARVGAPPPWLVELAHAFSPDGAGPPAAAALPGGPNDQAMDGLLDLVAPLIAQGRERVRTGARELCQARQALPFDPEGVEPILFAILPQQLLAMLNRTLVLELHVARLQGLLAGDTPAERFQSFAMRLRQRDVAIALLQEYPVLARQVTRCIGQWAAASLEFVRRLCADWELIRTTIGPLAAPGQLVRVSSASDRHRGGQTVLILTFSSGFQLVYKPKPLGIDAHFQELLAWLNDRADLPPFRRLTILDRGDYGWVEYVTPHSCTSEQEIRRFYQRQGAYLALLYALAATDMHFENLIAAGEQPLLIDLEALFHPRLGNFDARRNDQLLAAAADDSVLSIGLLPQRAWAGGETDGIDISGLGATDGQRSPFAVPQWHGAGTDEVHLVRQRAELPPGQHRPTLHGRSVDVRACREDLITGFTRMYRLLADHRDELLAEGGPLARFAADPVRVLVRPTAAYARLLAESFHPDLLRDALDRDRFFDRLWVSVEYQPALVHVIPAERADLLQGDIPLFSTRPDAQEIWSSTGQPIVGVCSESGMARARRRIRQLSERDLDRQLWFIRASLAALPTAGAPAPRPAAMPAASGRVDARRLLAAACEVGDRLAAVALRDADDVAWIGLLEQGRHWVIDSLKLDLYHGLPGVALFLAYLGSITQDERYTALACAALHKMRLQIAWGETGIASIGGFVGWGGVIYTLTQLGVLWDEPALLAEAEDLVELLPPLIEQDEQLDVISGAAGCLASLISLYRCAPSARTLAAAVQCGERLIARARPIESGIGWVTLGGRQALAGFAHGAAGIAWGLLELAALTGEERFRTAALAALDYERRLFSPQHQNWPDLRTEAANSQEEGQPRSSFLIAWCHGAAGIGLARLRSLQHLDDPAIRAEIDTALWTTLAHGFGHDHVLCHGDLGNLELLLQASQILEDSGLRSEVDRRAAGILADSAHNGWRCGTPATVETPGLMVGLAGIGYQLLRLAAPDRVPAVLTLDPPPGARSARWRESLARLRHAQTLTAARVTQAISTMERPTAYCIRINLDDRQALREAARPRREDDYTPEWLRTHPYTPPIGVLRQLFYEPNVARLRQATEAAGITDFHLAIIRHPLVAGDGGDERVGLPMHFATGFTYEARIAGRTRQVRVAGPLFISMLHHVIAWPDVPLEEKVFTAQHVFAEYLEGVPDYDLTVISMPKRAYKEHSFEIRAGNSLTHTLMLRACRSLDYYREQDEVGFYFLAHASDPNGELREALFGDERFQAAYNAVRQIWSVDYVREKEDTHARGLKGLVAQIVRTARAPGRSGG